jgi:hypothetical protein
MSKGRGEEGVGKRVSCPALDDERLGNRSIDDVQEHQFGDLGIDGFFCRPVQLFKGNIRTGHCDQSKHAAPTFIYVSQVCVDQFPDLLRYLRALPIDRPPLTVRKRYLITFLHGSDRFGNQEGIP